MDAVSPSSSSSSSSSSGRRRAPPSAAAAGAAASAAALGNPRGVSNTFRRRWKTEDFEARAAAREREEEEEAAAAAASAAAAALGKKKKRRDPAPALPASEQRPAEARPNEGLDLERHINRRVTVAEGAPDRARSPFFCTTCECLLKDSLAFLDHINGKRHRAATGTNARAPRPTVSDIRARIAQHKRAADGAAALDALKRPRTAVPPRVPAAPSRADDGREGVGDIHDEAAEEGEGATADAADATRLPDAFGTSKK